MAKATIGPDFCERINHSLEEVQGVLQFMVSTGKVTQEDSDLFLAVISGKTREELATTVDLSASSISTRVNRVSRRVHYILVQRTEEQKYLGVTDIEDFSKVANTDLMLTREVFDHPERFQIEEDAAWKVFKLYLSGHSLNDIAQRMPEVPDVRRAFSAEAVSVAFAVDEASRTVELWDTGSEVRTMATSHNDFMATEDDFQRCLKDYRATNTIQCDILVAYCSGTKAREVVRHLNLCYGVLISELNAASAQMRIMLNDQKLKKAPTTPRASSPLSAMNLG